MSGSDFASQAHTPQCLGTGSRRDCGLVFTLTFGGIQLVAKLLAAVFFVERTEAPVRMDISPLARASSAAGNQEVSFHRFIQRIWRIR